MSSGWFSRQEIVELAATEFPDISGKVLNGTIGQYWSDSVNPKWAPWKAIRARGLRVVEADGRRHLQKDTGCPATPPARKELASTSLPSSQRLAADLISKPPLQRVSPKAIGENAPLGSGVREMWNSNDPDLWRQGLDRYWTFVKPSHLALEREIDRLDAETVKAMDTHQWYTFLLEKYFRWKYTAPNRYGSTTKLLRNYESNDGLVALHGIKGRLFGFNKSDVRQGLSLACSIKGLGTAGASGLLAILFPKHFGTVDQFAVKALAEIPELPERELVQAMHPESLKLDDGVVLIQIMRRTAGELNSVHSMDFWTPRKVDMVLWTCAR
jgi:hypothetical protein